MNENNRENEDSVMFKAYDELVQNEHAHFHPRSNDITTLHYVDKYYDAGGVTYDTSEQHITTAVSEQQGNDGQIVVATVTSDVQGQSYFTFKNTYNTTPVTLTGNTAINVQKTFQGRPWTGSDEFMFTITAIQAPDGVTAPLPDVTTVAVDSPAAGAKNTTTFGNMTFKYQCWELRIPYS